MRIRKHWQLRTRNATVLVIRKQDTWPGDIPVEPDEIALDLDRWLAHPAIRSKVGELFLHVAAHTTGSSRPGQAEDPAAVTARVRQALDAAGLTLIQGPHGPYWEPSR
jgi:hypothetical protein